MSSNGPSFGKMVLAVALGIVLAPMLIAGGCAGLAGGLIALPNSQPDMWTGIGVLFLAFLYVVLRLR